MPNWLEMILDSDEKVFELGQPKVDMQELKEVCLDLIIKGWELGVITWLPKGATKDYEERCARVKSNWVEKHMPYITEFNAISYGTPKQLYANKGLINILVDDDEKVRKMWEQPTTQNQLTIDANENIIDVLKGLL
jgi:hypothetical protein